MTQTADQLAKQSQQLDAREAYIAAQEKIAEATAKEIEKAKRELELLKSTIAARETMLGQQRERQEQQDKLYASSEQKLKTVSEREQQTLKGVQDEISAAKVELGFIKTSIQERTEYQGQQEAAINTQAEAANAKLRGLDYDIKETTQVLKDLKREEQATRAKCKELEVSLQTTRDNFTPELERHEADITAIMVRKEAAQAEEQDVKQAIYDLRTEYNGLLDKRQQVHNDIAAKLKTLDIREREIMAKRDAIEQERIRVAKADHYRTSTNSLYGVE